jgi:hypothetical protein
VKLDPTVIEWLTVGRQIHRFLRVTPLKFTATPLGLGFGETRFASPSRAFKVLYLGKSIVTSLAETVIRDRFVGRAKRRLTREEIEAWGIAEVTAKSPLALLDLRTTGVIQLGVATNTIRGKAHKAGRAFSEVLYAQAPGIDGILYQSRLTNGSCIAVYDRGVAKLAAGNLEPLITQQALIPALNHLNVTVL